MGRADGRTSHPLARLADNHNSILAFGIIETPGIDPKFRKALFVTDLVLVAVGYHLDDFFLCHHDS